MMAYAIGYDWSVRSMGKAIDAIYDAMLELEKDGSKLLDKNFTSNIFSKIDTDEDGNEGPDVDLLDKRRQNEKQTIKIRSRHSNPGNIKVDLI